MQKTDSLERPSCWERLKTVGEGDDRRWDEMVGWHHWLNGYESEQAPGVGDGKGSLACCSPWGRKESDTIERLNWTELNWMVCFPQAYRTKTSWLLLSSPPTHQKNVHELTRPSLHNYYKTSYHFPHGNTWFWGHWFSVACFACKVIKIFFSTSSKTLSLRVNLIPAYREVELSASLM